VANSRFYSNTAVACTLGVTIGTGATSVYATTTPSGYPNQFPFTLRLKDNNTGAVELMTVTAGAGTSASPWTVTRAYGGTTAKSFTSGQATIDHPGTADDFTTSRTHEATTSSTSGVHGLPSSAWAAATLAAIQETTLSNSTTSVVTWSSIPQTYNHLLIIAVARSTSTSVQVSNIACTVNGDSGTNYSYIAFQTDTISGSLSAPNAANNSSQTAWNNFIHIMGSQVGVTANRGGGFALLPFYSDTAGNKAFYGISGAGQGGGSLQSARVRAGWYSPGTQAGITSLSLACGSGNFQSGSFLGLYGVN
jgi:hypothetical protein